MGSSVTRVMVILQDEKERVVERGHSALDLYFVSSMLVPRGSACKGEVKVSTFV